MLFKIYFANGHYTSMKYAPITAFIQQTFLSIVQSGLRVCSVVVGGDLVVHALLKSPATPRVTEYAPLRLWMTL